MIARRIVYRAFFGRENSSGLLQQHRIVARFSNDRHSQQEGDVFEAKRTNALAETEFTEFQKTFGFHEDIALLQKENQKKEKRRFISYSVGAFVSIGVLTSAFLISIDPALEKAFTKAYLVHSTNLKLKKASLLNTRGSSLKKLRVIAEYFENMKSNSITQPTYTLILLEEIQQVLARHLLISNNEEILREISKLLVEVDLVLCNFKKYPAIESTYLKVLEKISESLVLFHIEHAPEARKALDLLQEGTAQQEIVLKIASKGYLTAPSLQSKNIFIQLLKILEIESLTEIQMRDIISEGCEIAQRLKSEKLNRNKEEIEFHVGKSEVTFEEFQEFQKQREQALSRSIIFTILPLVDRLEGSLKRGLKPEIVKITELVRSID